MTKSIRDRVLAGETVDTDKYRYVLRSCQDHEKQWAEIRRLPKAHLDTTAAINGWELVETIL